MAAERRQAWVHGNSGMLQTDHGFLVERLGYYLRLKADEPAEAWVHYALPTVLSPVGTRLTGVVVRMRTFGTASISRVHVWDGATQVAARDGLDVRSPTGRAARLGQGRDAFSELELDLEAQSHLQAGVSVSLLVVARAELDAAAIAGVGIGLVR